MGAGRIKQLLPLGGRPVLSRCLETLRAAGLEQVVVVLSPGVDAAEALSGFGVVVALNPDPESDMAASVRAGLGALGARATGVLVCLADHPLVSSGSVRTLAAAHAGRADALLVPVCDGRRGHPVLFPAAVIREVLDGRTLRQVREAHRQSVVELEVADDGVLFDMDTWEDYQAACERVAREPGSWSGPPARRACVALQRGGEAR
jgi:molybdenum cofactor cytidylyltransferase